MVVSNMINRSFMAPLRVECLKLVPRRLAGRDRVLPNWGREYLAREAQQRADKKEIAGEELQH
jgi:hypothetical protein